MDELAFGLNTFYFVVMGALVMWMAAGFTMLEAGLVRKKNTAEIVTKNIGLYSIACTMFMICGYSALYASSGNGVIPDFTFEFMHTEPGSAEVEYVDGSVYAAGASDFFFQVVFVATAVSIISGAVAERMNQWPFFALAAFVAGFVYPVQGYWNWGGGFLKTAVEDGGYGYIDFAGSGTVHLLGGACALAAALFIGPRMGKYGKVTGKLAGLFPKAKTNKLYGANMPIAALGTFILWLGWFGFNGGSQLAMGSFDDAVAVSKIFINTNLAACGGVLAAAAVTRLSGKTDVIQMLNGAIGGLVAITAEPLMPSPIAAILIGGVGGVIVVYGTKLLFAAKIDDVVGAIPAHLFAGVWGTLAVPITNSGTNFGSQLLGVVSINAFVFVVAFIVWSIMKATMGIRLSKEAELKGTDVSETGVIAYAIRD